MSQVCQAYLAEAVTFPGVWNRRGCLEWWAPLPGLSGAHSTGHRQSQAVSCALKTPRVLLDLCSPRPCTPPAPRAGPEGYKHHEDHHLWVLVGTWCYAGYFLDVLL